MPLSFGSSDSSGGNAGAQSGLNPLYGLVGTGLSLASQFSNGGLAPGSSQSQMSPFMQQQWQNTFNAQNAAANRTPQQAVAGFTPAQQQAMQNIQAMVGGSYGMSDLQGAQNNASALEQGVGSSQINNFMNPFTQSAINGTLGTMEQQRQQQDAAINSNANANGAWGGDRSAVANNLNDQSWNLAEGNVIGNLNDQGYQSAVNSALQNQTNQLSGNAQLQSTILNRINTATGLNMNELGVGNQQQAQNQAYANYPVQAAQIMGMNLNPNTGSKIGYTQNPYSAAAAGLQGGLQIGNNFAQLAKSGTSLYNQARGLLSNGSYDPYNDPSIFGDGGIYGADTSGDTGMMSDMQSIFGGDFSGAGGQAATAGSSAATDAGSQAAIAAADPAYAAGDFGIPMGTGAGAGAGAGAAGAGFAGAGGDALGTTAAADAGASFGGGGGGAAAAGAGAGAGLAMGAGALAAMYGLDVLDQSQAHYNPLDASNSLSASAANQAQSNPGMSSMLKYLSQLMLTNPNQAEQYLGGMKGNSLLTSRNYIQRA